MRDRPFLSASDSPRTYSELRADRRREDPDARRFDAALDQIAELEAQAADAADPAAAKRLQCEAEAMRCALAEHTGRSR